MAMHARGFVRLRRCETPTVRLKSRRRRARHYSTDSNSDDSYQFVVSLPLPSPPASASPLHPKQHPDHNTETVKEQGNLSGATDYDVQQTVKSWLAHSKERLDKAAKKVGVIFLPLAKYRSKYLQRSWCYFFAISQIKEQAAPERHL
ncbi:unnamed protein product [Ixodes pacificus]